MLMRATRLLSTHARVSRPRRGAACMASAAWAQADARRPMVAHVACKSLDTQVDYYTKHFGMQVLERSAKSAALGYGPLDKNFAVQVTEAPAGDALDIGTGFGHFGIVLPDVYSAVAKIKAEGGKVTRDAGPVKGGNTIIAFVEDPTGYKWELLQRGTTPEPLCQVMLRVKDLAKSIAWYRDVLGMELVRERENQQYKYNLGFMGYGPEDSNAVVELTWNYDPQDYTKGNAYSHVTIATTDLKKTAEAIRQVGGEILSEDSTSVTTQDPDGYRFAFAEQK